MKGYTVTVDISISKMGISKPIQVIEPETVCPICRDPVSQHNCGAAANVAKNLVKPSSTCNSIYHKLCFADLIKNNIDVKRPYICCVCRSVLQYKIKYGTKSRRMYKYSQMILAIQHYAVNPEGCDHSIGNRNCIDTVYGIM